MSSDADRKPPDDRELEDFLAGRHPVGRAYREASENESAPPELDALILGTAREAVRTPRVRRPRWVQPIAVAATLALSLGVLINLWRDPVTREQMVPTADPGLQRLEERVREDAPAPGSFKAEGASLPAAVGQDAARPTAPESKLGASARSVESEIEQRSEQERTEPRPVEEAIRKRKAVAGNPVAEEATIAPSKAEAARRPMADSTFGSADDLSGGSSPGFVGDPPPMMQRLPPPPPPAPAPVPPKPEPRVVAPAMGGLSGPREDSVPAPPKDQKETRDGPEPSSKQRAHEQDQDARAASSSMAPKSAAPATTPAPSAVPAPSGAAIQREAATDEVGTAPPEWIREIRAARDRGDTQAVQDLIKRVRAEYPAYALPEDLRALEVR